LEYEMKQAAKDLAFEKAAALRDQIMELKQIMALKDDSGAPAMAMVKDAVRARQKANPK